MAELHDIGGDIRLACTVSGDGPPLILMHGAEGNHRMFDALVPHLAGHFTVVAYDQRDCGYTENPAVASTLADLADDAAALLRVLGYRSAHVYGTSFGGRVAQALAHRHAQVIERLVLGSTWPLPFALDALNPDAVRDIYALREQLPASAEALAAYFLPQEFLDTRPELERIFANVQPSSERSLRRFATVAETPTLEPAAILAPSLVLVGEFDRVVPPAVTIAMADAMPHARHQLLAGLGHAAALQAPAEVAEQIRRFCLAATEQVAAP